MVQNWKKPSYHFHPVKSPNLNQKIIKEIQETGADLVENWQVLYDLLSAKLLLSVEVLYLLLLTLSLKEVNLKL